MDDTEKIDRCQCGSDQIFASRFRSRREWLIRYFLPIRYYRCRACNWRGPRVNSVSLKAWGRRLLTKALPVVLLLGLLIAALLTSTTTISQIFAPTVKTTKKK